MEMEALIMFLYLFEMLVTVVSRIFRVTGSSEHKPACNDLQNKQENDGGVSAVTPMLKLDSPPFEKLGPFVLISNRLPYLV